MQEELFLINNFYAFLFHSYKHAMFQDFFNKSITSDAVNWAHVYIITAGFSVLVFVINRHK